MLNNHQGPNEIVVDGVEIDNGDRRQDGQRQRQDDSAVDLEFAGPVDARAFEKLARDRGEKTAAKQNANQLATR